MDGPKSDWPDCKNLYKLFLLVKEFYENGPKDSRTTY